MFGWGGTVGGSEVGGCGCGLMGLKGVVWGRIEDGFVCFFLRGDRGGEGCASGSVLVGDHVRCGRKELASISVMRSGDLGVKSREG